MDPNKSSDAGRSLSTMVQPRCFPYIVQALLFLTLRMEISFALSFLLPLSGRPGEQIVRLSQLHAKIVTRSEHACPLVKKEK